MLVNYGGVMFCVAPNTRFLQVLSNGGVILEDSQGKFIGSKLLTGRPEGYKPKRFKVKVETSLEEL